MDRVVALRAGVLVLSLSLAGCGQDEPLRVGAKSVFSVDFHDDGRVSLSGPSARVLLHGGWAEALVEQNGSKRTIRTRDCSVAWQPASVPDGKPARFLYDSVYSSVCAEDGLVLSWFVEVDSADLSAITWARLENRTGAELTALRVSPLVAEGADAGLFVGNEPERLRILDNGSYVAADVDVKLHYVDEKRNALVAAILPIESRGGVVSNWNHAIFDLDGGESWIAGALTIDRAFPTFGTRYVSDEAPRFGGRAGLEFWADGALDFNGKILASGESVDSEAMYFSPSSDNPQLGLETYADAIAAWQGITVWTEREGGRRVPNGWNSWTGSSGTGGLGNDINEQMMSENLDVMAREFAPFGIDYFQVDDGYQIAYGDWYPDPKRFPNGMPEWTSRVEQKGLKPGLWIGAFSVDQNSALAAEHPDWIGRPEDNVTSGLIGGGPVLDLSNETVVAWLGDTMHRYQADWRMRWIKLDFAYRAFPYLPRHAPKLTSIEVYKRATQKIRDTLGNDVFYLGIALMGVNYGVVDGMRVTLDNGPLWEEADPFALLGTGQNFKGTVKNGARRYYLTDRVWVTHNDLLFFRTDKENPTPPVTLDEATTFASFMGLSGSIVKFGEDLRTLSPEQIQIWRKLLPIYPAGARPLDLFTRMYPEEWVLPVTGTLSGGSSSWTVVGLLNWGKNFDFSANGQAQPMEDAGRDYALDLEKLGLDANREYLASEFWSEKFLGKVGGSLKQSVPAHGHAVIALRESSGHPQFLGHNRHFTQGATDLVDETWDDAKKTLSLTFDVDQGASDAVPFEYHFRVFVPEGYALKSSDVGGGEVTQEGSVLVAKLTPIAPGRVTLAFAFQ